MSGPVDVLAVGPVTVSAKELEWLLISPAALRVLADYNDYNETMADACGADASFNRKRREWFSAEASRIESEWESERTPRQRVFVDNTAMADLIKAAHAIADEGCISTSRIKNLRVALANIGAAS